MSDENEEFLYYAPREGCGNNIKGICWAQFFTNRKFKIKFCLSTREFSYVFEDGEGFYVGKSITWEYYIKDGVYIKTSPWRSKMKIIG